MASVTGPSDARFETTAAVAATEASTIELQNNVETNAAHVHEAADDAAKAAQFKVPAAGVAIVNLEAGLAEKTDAAVAEGQANTQGYVQQAREIAGSALATAATYLPTSITGASTTDNTTTAGSGVLSNLSSAAGTAVETAKSAYTTASQAAAPHVETAKQTLQPHYETAKAAVQPHVDRLTEAVGNTVGTTPSKPADVPATTAPLESGNGHVGGPYTDNGTKSTVAFVLSMPFRIPPQ
ncbi:hypothetical protein BDW22DRAFT_1479693 [Trametopsis cervina]|nr:hypothetical protein BDW22DRAFT_1479693 [Trametopsis cervina]